MLKIGEYLVRMRCFLVCVVFYALDFRCPPSFFFPFQKKRKAAAVTNESTEAEMEDAGSPQKKKPTSSSESKDLCHSPMYWPRASLPPNRFLPSPVAQKEKIG